MMEHNVKVRNIFGDCTGIYTGIYDCYLCVMYSLDLKCMIELFLDEIQRLQNEVSKYKGLYEQEKKNKDMAINKHKELMKKVKHFSNQLLMDDEPPKKKRKIIIDID